jgi:hypothetical protein
LAQASSAWEEAGVAWEEASGVAWEEASGMAWEEALEEVLAQAPPQ